MNTLKTKPSIFQPLLTFLLWLKNKSIAIIALVLLMEWYKRIPPVVFDQASGRSSGGMAYSEILFAVIGILSVFVYGSLARLLMFREAAHYAENGDLMEDLTNGVETAELKQYWFATRWSLIAAIAIMAVTIR